ncbi:hypothetical protein LPB140_00890 [Sphingorhabdus lutea]|uniref:DUF2141 domain-containing protein n=2 Tax=Sphingorhabdus lutea TaxID=1913578 RepID=A0A1L3J945_9SPHN|nr:hypothetical protein LPB140_00890 [Sphingorhabdus lutea]
MAVTPLNPIPTARAATSTKSIIEINFTNIRNIKGKIMLCLTAQPKAFPDCSKDKEAISQIVTANGIGTVKLVVPKGGTYAISVIHDENSNGKMDMAIMIPKEGFGFSRNPAIGFGPPKFKSASFTIGDGMTIKQNIKMKYML